MPTQAQEIDGHVLINDIEALGEHVLRAGDLIEVELMESLPSGYVGRATRLLSESRAPKDSAPALMRTDASLDTDESSPLRQEPAQERPDALGEKRAPSESATRIASLLQ